MRPVDQDKFYVAGVSRGNCQQAATASLLGIDIDQVPDFMASDDFWGSFDAFLKDHGLKQVLLPGNLAPNCHYLAYGPAARGVRHAVVYKTGRLAHDPHPSRAGLLSVDSISLIIPLDYTPHFPAA